MYLHSTRLLSGLLSRYAQFSEGKCHANVFSVTCINTWQLRTELTALRRIFHVLWYNIVDYLQFWNHLMITCYYSYRYKVLPQFLRRLFEKSRILPCTFYNLPAQAVLIQYYMYKTMHLESHTHWSDINCWYVTWGSYHVYKRITNYRSHPVGTNCHNYGMSVNNISLTLTPWLQ